MLDEDIDVVIPWVDNTDQFGAIRLNSILI